MGRNTVACTCDQVKTGYLNRDASILLTEANQKLFATANGDFTSQVVHEKNMQQGVWNRTVLTITGVSRKGS